MELTKHAHACVVLDKGYGRLVFDPGAFESNAAELVASTDTVLITHEHYDHFDEELLAEALDERPELRVYGPAAVVGRWASRDGQCVAVSEGDRLQLAGFDVTVHGRDHATIHPDIPGVANVGYLVDGDVYHPGDAYHVPSAPVRTLLLPTSGPWTKMAEAVDYVRAVAPANLVQIHEMMLSELGQQATARYMSPGNLTSVALTAVPQGETISL